VAAPTDTIAAVATPPGRGGVGIVRVSGPGARATARALLGEVPPARRAVHREFADAAGAAIDVGLALFFPAPASFTGEDVLELHGHGGPVVLDLLLARVVETGARLARPGEFSERAFLNDKIDLAQAEAVAALVEAASEDAARSARRALEGALSERARALAAGVAELRTFVEAAIDFPDEEIDFLEDRAVDGRLAALLADLERTFATARQGRLLQEGVTVVLAGSPNVGKSSLLNRLAERESAIVTEVPGTTRDPVREHVVIHGLPVHVVDTAGLRAGTDVVERIGVERARAAIRDADALLLVVDDRAGPKDADLAVRADLAAGAPLVLVRNKIDLSGAPAGACAPPDAAGGGGTVAAVRVCALDGEGVDALREALVRAVGFDLRGEGVFAARRRHLEALGRARAALAAARDQLAAARAGELLAEDLRAAQHALGEITGEFTSEDLLARIFSGFCIGK